MDSANAEIMALQILNWVAADTEIMDRFAALSGIAPQDMLERADDAEALAALVDFLLADEKLLTQFCEAHEIDPETPAQARMFLAGGDTPHWT